MDSNYNLKLFSLYNKISVKKPFKEIKFASNNKGKTLLNNLTHNPYKIYSIKLKEANKVQNKTLYDKNNFFHKLSNEMLSKEKKINNIKYAKNESKNIPIRFNQKRFNFEKNPKRCLSQEKIDFKLLASVSPIDNREKGEEDDFDGGEDENGNDYQDINAFFDRVNKEFEDIGGLIDIVFIVGEKTYKFSKNEFVILKIIQNELEEKYGLKIKEFFYEDIKLNVFKSLKENHLKNNCSIKVVLQ